MLAKREIRVSLGPVATPVNLCAGPAMWRWAEAHPTVEYLTVEWADEVPPQPIHRHE
ncbi:ATPase [Pseudomonas sp. MT-1]|nr:ATPase [Pseudomonas sp. MT-1]